MRNVRIFSVQGRLFLPAIAVSVFVFFGIVAFFTYTALYERQIDLERDIGQRLTRQVSDAMGLWLKDKVHLAQVLAASQVVRELCDKPDDPDVRDRAEAFLRLSHAAYAEQFTLMSVMYLRPDPEKALVLIKDGKPFTVPDGASIIDSINGRSIGVADMNFSYVRAIVNGNTGFISEAKPNAVAGLSPLFMVTAPVYDKDGRLAGIFGFGVKLDHVINAYIAKTVPDAFGLLEILDDRGLYVGQSEPSLLLNPGAAVFTKQLLHHLRQEQGGDFVVQRQGRDELYVASPVLVETPMANAWWVLYHRPTEAVGLDVRPYLYALIAAVLLGTLFVTGIAANSRAASLRVGRQDMLRRDAERKNLYVDNAPYGLLILDSNGGIQEANPAACRLFGYEAGAVIGLSVFDLIPACPLESAGAEQELDMTPDGDWAFLPAKHRHGEELYVTVAPRNLDSDNVMLFLRGVTELVKQQKKAKLLSDELNSTFRESERLRLEAERANQAKSDFLANMSHEIRTPMNAVMGMSQLLAQGSLDDRQRNFVVKINQAARSLLGIINDILDFSKIEAGHLEIEHVPFTMKDIIDSLHRLFIRNCEEKNISLTLAVDPRIPASLLGDPLRLGQTLINLVSNAVKFTHNGAVTVTCTAETVTATRAFLRIDVEDSGIGIEEKQINQLFTPFSQGDSSTTRCYGGTGLGLAISKRLVDLMGGILSVRSQRGIGSVFTVSCAFDVDQSRSQSDDSSRIVDGAVIQAENALLGRSILLVEDIEINQEVAVELLRQTGAVITVAANGKEAVDLVAESMQPGEEPYDVILMDIQMPVMDGYDATKTLRSMGVNAPIIAMTAHAMVEERKRCLLAGMDDHIAKPVDLQVMLESILRALALRQA